MKATLEFTLPEEKTEHLLAVKAQDLHATIWNTDNQLRSWLKYGGCPHKTPEALMEHIRELLTLPEDLL